MTQIEQYLRQRIGLDSASIGSTLIQRSVRLRMKSRGIKKLEEYKRLLTTSSEEYEELVESVVVTETWFFRDQEPFAAFVQMVKSEWLPAHPASQLRVLSLPCASGEEPYSLAIALLEAGLPRERFDIEGVDLSTRALARAQRAVYKRNSFRGKDLSFRGRHFHAIKEGYELCKDVRECVHFHRANLLDDGFLTGRPTYDYIFCRNLLIYFDRPTQHKALERIRRLLSPSGILWVGAAEHPLATDYGYVSAQIPRAFACRHAGLTPDKKVVRPALVRSSHLKGAPLGTVVNSGLAPAAKSSVDKNASSRVPERTNDGDVAGRLLAEHPAEAAGPSLQKARLLADSGRLQEAVEMCDELLRKGGASAELYYLLGLARDAAGDAGATDFYRKALYLNPQHYEALWQMALSSEKSGDHALARTYKRRAERARKVELAES